jgi:hypothetical protein
MTYSPMASPALHAEPRHPASGGEAGIGLRLGQYPIVAPVRGELKINRAHGFIGIWVLSLEAPSLG